MAAQDTSVSSDRSSVRIPSQIFPKSRCSLWNKTSVGQPVLLHLNHYRKPRVCVPEKILKLIQHQCENYGQTSHVLIGTLVVDDDAEGIQIEVDRLDTRPNVPVSSFDLSNGNVIVRLDVTNNSTNVRTASLDDYMHAFKNLQSRCCSKDTINLCSFLHLHGWGSFYSNAHTSVLHLDFDMVTMEKIFKSTPVTPVPIVSTALYKNLTSSRRLSSMQGTPKTGYLTMDNTRKLLLVLESDPKAALLPVIGIWVSGVDFIHHPFVWAACLRYIHNTHLQDRVCIPPDEFLLVLYTELQSRTEFYQCEANNSCLQFELSSGHEVMNMDKVLTSTGNSDFVEVEIEPVHPGKKMEIFEAAKMQHGINSEVRLISVPGQEDLEPRCAPVPHAEKVPIFHPMVPDVSILWNDNHNSSSLSYGRPEDELISQQQQHGRRSNMETSLKQGFSAPEKFAHPALVSPTGELHHPRYSPQLHTRPHLSHHYSPAGQFGQRIPLPNFPQPSPQPELPPENSAHFYVSDQLTRTALPPTHSRTFQHSSNYNSSQTSESIPFVPFVPSSKMGLTDSTVAPSSHDCYQHQATPAVTHTKYHSLPSSKICDSNYQVFDTDENISHQGYPHNSSNLRIIQNSKISQSLIASPFRADQSQANTPVSVSNYAQDPVRHLHSNIQQLSAVSHHLQPSCTREHQHRAILNTIVEEAFSSPFSSLKKPSQHLEKESYVADSLELNDGDIKNKESSGIHPSTNNSARSSGEDSGFNVTSERLSISVPEYTSASVVTLPSASVLAASSASTITPTSPSLQQHIDNWDLIPVEVRAILIHQNEQLKLLQQQIQVLQSQLITQPKQASSQVIAIEEVTRIQKLQPTKYSSVAVNTSFFGDDNNNADTQSRDHQLEEITPIKPVLQENVISPVISLKRTDAPNTSSLPLKVHHKQLRPGFEPLPAVGNIAGTVSNMDFPACQSPQESSHSSLEDMNQKVLDDAITCVDGFKQTINTGVSELGADTTEPEYMSSFNDRSHPDHIVSNYYRQTQEDSYSTLGEDAADPKPHYNQILKNIQIFMTNSGSQDSEPSSSAVAESETALQKTSSKFETSSSSIFVPDVSNVSMLLSYGSDNWHSMEINSMAMKYLSDEQLSHAAKLHQSSRGNSLKPARILQQVISGYKSLALDTTSTPDVSCLGISPNNMTMGTRMYLENHGLLGNDISFLEQSVLGHNPQLRTDFSILTNVGNVERTNLSVSICGEVHDYVEGLRKPRSPSQQPIHRDTNDTALLPGTSQVSAQTNNENWLPDKPRTADSGSSPILPSLKNDVKVGPLMCKRNVLQEVKPQAFVNVKTGIGNAQILNSGIEREEENVLDIDMLKQMTKLL